MFEPLRHNANLFTRYLPKSLIISYIQCFHMYDAPLKFIVRCLVYFKSYSAKCDYNQNGRTCPPPGHVRPVPFEHAPVIKVQYNNDNN